MVAHPQWKVKEVGNNPTFHGAIDASKAESLLTKQNKICCHLMRYSESRDEYMLSVLKKKEDNRYLFHNFDIIIEQSDEKGATYEVFGSDKEFASIVELLNYYKKNPLNYSIGNIGRGIESESKRTTDSIVDTGSPGDQSG